MIEYGAEEEREGETDREVWGLEPHHGAIICSDGDTGRCGESQEEWINRYGGLEPK